MLGKLPLHGQACNQLTTSRFMEDEWSPEEVEEVTALYCVQRIITTKQEIAVFQTKNPTLRRYEEGALQQELVQMAAAVLKWEETFMRKTGWWFSGRVMGFQVVTNPHFFEEKRVGHYESKTGWWFSGRVMGFQVVINPLFLEEMRVGHYLETLDTPREPPARLPHESFLPFQHRRGHLYQLLLECSLLVPSQGRILGLKDLNLLLGRDDTLDAVEGSQSERIPRPMFLRWNGHGGGCAEWHGNGSHSRGRGPTVQHLQHGDEQQQQQQHLQHLQL